ncbi:MAG: GTPase Era [Alphaproteobacteria bacterium]|nr:GTPase Era [Rickettsiales bacterium]
MDMDFSTGGLNAKEGRKSLFVALSGSPNVGKSSILNTLLGFKVAAVSYKPQTTRNSIRGIITEEDTQIVFVDSPGFFSPKLELSKKIVKNAARVISDVQIVCVVIDAQKGLNKATKKLLEKCYDLKKVIVVVINKTDLVKPPLLLSLAQEAFSNKGVIDVLFTSCKEKRGFLLLKQYFLNKAEPDNWYYDSRHNTDRDVNFIAAEITREKLFLLLKNEVPYGTSVITTLVCKNKNKSIAIEQQIVIERENHKSIIIGKSGLMLKEVCRRATFDLEQILKTRVALSVSVKTQKGWVRDWDGF